MPFEKHLRRLYRMRDLPGITGLSRSELYRRIKLGTFPHPIKIGLRAVAWYSADISRWLESPLTYRTVADSDSEPD
ncbi:DNA-binding protein [Bordetella tumbae]